MKILLTGKTGQLGYELERTLQGLGDVVALDRQQMDLTDLDQIRDVIRTVQPKLIINPAAYTAVDLAESNRDVAMRINAEAPAVMADEARKLGAAMIHYSTDYVFDGDNPGSYSETDTPNPQSAYGRSKLAGEQAIQAAGIPHLILRTSWIYGLRGKNFLLTVRRLAQERDELRIVADQFGAPTWSRTLAEVTGHALAQLQSGIRHADLNLDAWAEHTGLYHVSAQGKTSWHGFTQAIIAHPTVLKKPQVTPIATLDYPLPAKRPPNSVLSSERFMNTFCSLPNWDDALKLCLD
ncbi:dTDP-4-dehydrorhamnose reductase [Herminiimonas aquatilis]|uniref:dTDP-4-dehydrorhamnose reductase n=1 Tax=Herminiimonas aquatilis TaxID=345342 RepID=A0ABW2J703_9BURK